jgi:glycosyltransferase involved in cell wall biosynthesis
MYYGYNPLPSLSEVVSGGIIKSIELSGKIPNATQAPNLLYLVSSALPIHFNYLIRSAKRHGVKIILNQNGVAYHAWHGSGWSKANKILADVYHNADYVIFQSKFCKQATERFLGLSEAPHTILYNSIDTARYLPGDSSQLEPFTLLIAGTHNNANRIKISLETLAELRKLNTAYRLVIAGSLNWRRDNKKAEQEMKNWIWELDLENAVEIFEKYTQRQSIELFQRVALLLHVQYNDVCPRLLVESLACGVPVVYSATGGSPEIVGSDAGIGIELPLDYQQEHYPKPTDLATAVKEVMENYTSYSKAARKKAVQYFSLARWIEEHEKIIVTLLQ